MTKNARIYFGLELNGSMNLNWNFYPFRNLKI